MAANEVVKNSAYRVWSELENVWKKYALWTTAKQVECTDGQSVEDKIGGIKGITTSTNVNEEGYVADAKAVSELSKDIKSVQTSMGDCSFSVKTDGVYVTYKPTGGADSVTKKLGSEAKLIASGKSGTVTLDIASLCPNDYKKLTADNFLVVATGITATSDIGWGSTRHDESQSGTGNNTITKAYTASSGSLKITSPTCAVSTKTSSVWVYNDTNTGGGENRYYRGSFQANIVYSVYLLG